MRIMMRRLPLGLVWALLAAGALAQAPDDLVTVLPEFEDENWRNLTYFAGKWGPQ